MQQALQRAVLKLAAYQLVLPLHITLQVTAELLVLVDPPPHPQRHLIKDLRLPFQLLAELVMNSLVGLAPQLREP